MNLGDCPYCDDFIGFLKVPDKCPAYAIVQCESCGKDIWYRFSRINPMAWTIEDFEKEFIIEKENRRITERNPQPKVEMPKEIIDGLIELIDNFILNGDSKIKPRGIL